MTIHRVLETGATAWHVYSGAELVLVLTDRDLTTLMASIIDQMQRAVRSIDGPLLLTES